MKKNGIRAAILERIVPSVLMFSMILTSFGNIAVANDGATAPADPAAADQTISAEEPTETPALEEDEKEKTPETPVVTQPGEEADDSELPADPEFVEDDTDEMPATPTLDIIDAVVQELVMPLAVQMVPTAIAACTQTTTVHSTNLANWNLSQSSTDGSASNTIVEDGLQIKTEATGHRKAAGYYTTNFALWDLGTNSIAQTFEYTTNSGSIKPGAQLVIDFDNNGTPDGTLVGETVYGNNWWLTNSSPGFVKNGAPHTGGGNGSNWYGTAEEWAAAFPTARVKAIGYSLGSGVTGDYTITKIFAGCTNYTFDLPPAQPPIKVHIFKHLKTAAGTEQVPNTSTAPSFPMVAVYDIAGVAAGSDPYALGDFGGAGGSDNGLKYAANTIPLSQGDDYATYENTDGSVVVPAGGACVADKYRLVGYKVGDTLSAAESATLTTTSPSFNNIQENKYVIVVNEDCDDFSAPSVPVNGQPHATVLDTNSFTFTWNASTDNSSDPVTYEFQSSLNPTESGGVLTTGLWQSGTLPSNSIVSTGAPDGVWYWQVRAKDAMGNYSAWSQIWNVTLDTVDPAAPTHLSPANNSIVTTSTFLFDWSDVTDATAVVYDWVGSLSNTLNPDGSLAAVLASHSGLTDSSVNSPGTPDNTYYWQVRARDEGGNASAWTTPWKVTVDTTTPPPPPTSMIIEPTDGEVTSGSTDLLAFYADQNGDNNDAVQWAVRAGTCAASTGTVFGNVDGKNTPFTWNGINFQSAIDTTTVANGSYCFVFNPTEDAGNTNQRLTRTFTIQNTPTPVPPTPPTPTTVTVTSDTSTGENALGWLFNRDQNTKTPYEFNDNTASIGNGSLFVPQITNDSANTVKDKFVGELFLGSTPVASVNSISYDFKIAAPADTAEEKFYMNVYANFGVSDDNKYYDCRYNVVPTVGSTGTFTTVSFDPTLTYPVTTRGGASASPFACPASPAGMDLLSPGSNIRMIALNVGDESGSDTGVSGYFDKVYVNTDSSITIYDFELEEAPVVTNNGGGRSGGRSNSQGQVLGASTEDDSSTGGQVLGAACPLITEYLREGDADNAEQVMSLQGFLNGELGVSLALSGMFDAVTTSAVKVFQSKYAAEVLLPWGLTAETPTGYVYKTTMWKINDIACPDLEVATPEVP